MYHPIGKGPLFRVASATSGNVWPDPVLGHGAYYVGIDANRYSRPDRLTVYGALTVPGSLPTLRTKLPLRSLYLSRHGLIHPGDESSCGHRSRNRHAAPANREVTRGGYPIQDR